MRAQNLDQAVDHIIVAVDELNEMLDLDLGDLEFEAAASLLARLRHARMLAQTLEGSFERHIGQVGPYGVTELVGVGLVTVRRTKDRKEWAHDRWKSDVRSRIIERELDADGLPDTVVDPDTGNVIELPDLLHGVIEQAQDVHGAGAPKLTALKALGLNGDDYCTTIKGRHTVQIDTASGATDEIGRAHV